MKKYLTDWFWIGGGVPAPEPDPALFYHTTITVADGNANAFVYSPEGVNIPPDGGWPLVIFFGGDGTSGNTTRTFTNQATSTANSVTYTLSPTASLYRIVPSTIVVKRNGVAVAWGSPGGTITGSGITGSVTSFDRDEANQNTSPTISVTFDTNQSGNTIVFDYVDTTVVGEGPARWINLGDTLDDRCVFIVIQNIPSTADFDRDYWDKTVEYAWNNFTINPNRISAAGISRGARQIIDRFSDGVDTSVLKTRYQFWIDETTGVVYTSSAAGRVASGVASIVCGTASYGGSFTAANYTDIGIAIVHGTSDGTLTNNTPTFAATLGGNNEPPYILNISGGFHNYDVWDGKCYKRLYRVGPTTGSITTADWDWVDFLLKYSKNEEERATLFVEQVERRRYNNERDVIDYRHAARKVALLGAGAVKTALESRLSTVKSSIESTGTRWVINFGSSTYEEANPPYNNLTTGIAGTAINNLTTYYSTGSGDSDMDFQNAVNTGGGVPDIASNRRTFTGGFTLKANSGGLGLTGFPLASLQFSTVPSGDYTLRFYHNVGVANFSTDPRIRVTVNSVTKSGYSAINTLIGYIEFTNVPHTALASIEASYDTSANTNLTILEIYKQP